MAQTLLSVHNGEHRQECLCHMNALEILLAISTRPTSARRGTERICAARSAASMRRRCSRGSHRHNIWELVAHAAYWKYAVRRRLIGAKRGSFPLKGSNWFTSPAQDEEAWHDIVVVLDVEHRQLRDAVASLSLKEIGAPKTARLVYGVAAHDLYHTGQIQLLKRLT